MIEQTTRQQGKEAGKKYQYTEAKKNIMFFSNL